MKKPLLTMFALGGLVSAYAQSDSTEAAERTLLQPQYLQPVEIRSLRAGSDAPFAKIELDSKEIKKANLGQDLPYLLQYTPSAVVTSDAGAGVGYTGIRVRGTDGTRINVTLNGIPVNDPESQGTFFVNFSDLASSTGSIQLQRGVGTSTNGAGAFGATMSISNMQQYEKAGAELYSSYGSFDTWRNTLKAGTGLLKGGFQFDVRLSKINSRGYIDRSNSDLKSMQFIAGWKVSDKTQLRFMLMTGKEMTKQAWNGVVQDSLATNRTFNELGAMTGGGYYNNQTDNYQQDYYQFFVDHKFSKYISGHAALFMTRGRGYYQEYKQDQAYGSYGLPDYVTGNDTLTSTDLTRQLWLDNYYYGSVFSLIYEKNKTQLTFGGGWNQYAGNHYGDVLWTMNGGVPDNYRWYDLNSQKNDLNLYLKLQQYAGEKLMLFGDLQYRNVAYNIYGFRDNPAIQPMPVYNFFNPKAGATYFIANNGHKVEKLYASIAVANKEPNRTDFEASPVDQPKHEQLYDVEVGFDRTVSKLHLNANYYYMSYKSQLVLTGQINDVGAYTRTNVDNSYRMGIELQASYVPTYWLKAFANATFSQNKIKNFTEYIDNYDDPYGVQNVVKHGTTDIAFSPNVLGSGGLTFSPFRYMQHGQSFEMDLLGKYVGKQYLDNTSDDNRSIDPYGLCDIRIRYSIKTKAVKELGFNLMLNNIFDKKYASNGYTFSYISGAQLNTVNYYYPQAGFNFLLGVNMKW
ncbi:MAG: TonB-dependent receptor plug domain-containing protein [Chitinophagaceae bacterium]|nr:TonB-dependent receptor plug domain-containing protein [Chitinophagaceae bacterium]MCB9044613.1 TonB-dependent receptor plug domain-containing protein [Chitinophagales bacterium]